MRRPSRQFRGFLISTVLAALGFALLAPASGQASVAGFQQYTFPQSQPSVQSQGGKSSDVDAPVKTPAIVGGNETTFEKYPWPGEIVINGQHHCGGSLVHQRVVLTAAHCVVDSSGNFYPAFTTYQAFTGRTMTGTGGEELVPRNAFVPNSYNPGAFPNDYAFLTLGSPSSRPQIKIAGPDEAATWRVGRNLVASGYGRIVEGGAGSPVLKEVNMPRIGDDVCGGPDVYFTSFQAQVMMCAGSMAGGQSTCQGDSGGPLMAPIDGGYRLVGVVSWADGCAKPNRPTVFTRVADPAYGKTISDGLKTIASQVDPGGFPGVDASVEIIGSGATPLGCQPARGAAAAAAAAVTAASKKSAAAKKAVKAAKKAVKKARKKSKSAKKKAAKKLKTANKQVKKTTASLKKSKSTAKTASAGAQAACS